MLKFIISCFLLLTAFTAQPESRALPSGTVLERDAEGIWRIDLETKTRTLYYRFPTDVFFQGEFIDYTEQVLYTVEVPRPQKPAFWYYDVLNLVKIDLISGEKTILYTGQGIGVSPWYIYPNSKEYILLLKYPRNHVRTRALPTACLLDVKAASCQQVPENSIRTLYFVNIPVWLDPFTFTTGSRVYNLLTGDVEGTPFQTWAFFQLIPFEGTHQFLVAARPPSTRFTDVTGAGIYILDTDMFQLSEKLCDIPPFTNISIPYLSNDRHFIRYGWRNRTDYSYTVFDLETCHIVMEINNLSIFAWLPRDYLLGQKVDAEGNRGDVVLINTDIGSVKTLFERDERANFYVVP